jgi:predicted nuclease of predicted toxin-antitoxin system
MNIVVDENLPRRTVDELRAMSHIVTDIRGTPQEGALDDSLWLLAQQKQALLITTDRGFSHKRNEAHWGVLIIALRQPNRAKIHAKVMYALSEYTDWWGLMVIMQDTVLRVIRSANDGAL